MAHNTRACLTISLFMPRILSIFFVFVITIAVQTWCGVVQAHQPSASVLPLYLQESLDAKGLPLPLSPGMVKLIAYFERETGLQIEVHFLPWNRAQRMTLDGKGMIWAFSKTSDRMRSYQYSETVMQSRIWAIAHAEPRFELRSIKDLKGKTISVERGVSHGLVFEQAKNTLFKVDEDAASATVRFKKLIAQRCDVLLWGLVQFEKPEPLLKYLHEVYLPSLKDDALINEKFYVSDTPLFLDTLHFASAKGAFSAEMQKMNLAIVHGLKTGELNRLLREMK